MTKRQPTTKRLQYFVVILIWPLHFPFLISPTQLCFLIEHRFAMDMNKFLHMGQRLGLSVLDVIVILLYCHWKTNKQTDWQTDKQKNNRKHTLPSSISSFSQTKNTEIHKCYGSWAHFSAIVKNLGFCVNHHHILIGTSRNKQKVEAHVICILMTLKPKPSADFSQWLHVDVKKYRGQYRILRHSKGQEEPCWSVQRSI